METTTKLIIQQANEFIEALELLKTLNLPEGFFSIRLESLLKFVNVKYFDYININ